MSTSLTSSERPVRYSRLTFDLPRAPDKDRTTSGVLRSLIRMLTLLIVLLPLVVVGITLMPALFVGLVILSPAAFPILLVAMLGVADCGSAETRNSSGGAG